MQPLSRTLHHANETLSLQGAVGRVTHADCRTELTVSGGGSTLHCDAFGSPYTKVSRITSHNTRVVDAFVRTLQDHTLELRLIDPEVGLAPGQWVTVLVGQSPRGSYAVGLLNHDTMKLEVLHSGVRALVHPTPLRTALLWLLVCAGVPTFLSGAVAEAIPTVLAGIVALLLAITVFALAPSRDAKAGRFHQDIGAWLLELKRHLQHHGWTPPAPSAPSPMYRPAFTA